VRVIPVRKEGGAAPVSVASVAPMKLAEPTEPVARVATVVTGEGEGVTSALRLSLALMDPLAWLPPMVAFLCGAAASGRLTGGRELLSGGDGPGTLVPTLAGMALAGPVLCGFARVVNNGSDHPTAPVTPVAVGDARGEPEPPVIPSAARLALPQVIMTGTALLALGVLLAFMFGGAVVPLAGAGLLLGLAYSLPPLRLKRNGWLGNGVVAVACVALPWLAGTVALSGGQPHPIGLILAALFTIGAHGILTPRHFGSITADHVRGIRTLPVLLGARGAAVCASTLLNMAQLVALMLAFVLGHLLVGGLLVLLLVGQQALQRAWFAHPETRAPWSPATIIRLLYLAAMLLAAFGVAAPAALP